MEGLLSLAGEVLEVDSLAPSDSWFGQGGDSLTALQFSVLPEETWGLAVDVDQIMEANSFEVLLDHISGLRPR